MIRYLCDEVSCEKPMDTDGFVVATDYHKEGSFIVWPFPMGCELKELHSELRFSCCKEHLMNRLKRIVEQI